MPYPALQEHPLGEEALLIYFFTTKMVFCSKLREKASRQTSANSTESPLSSSRHKFIMIATF
jgi:hypothetical protein